MVKTINKIIIFVYLFVTVLIVLYPLVYLVSSSFTPGRTIGDMPVIPFSAGFTTQHFVDLFTQTNYLIWFRNSFIIAISTSLSTVLVCTLAAYTFSRFKFTLKKSLMLILLILQVFPSILGMVAIFVLLLRIGGLDTLWGLVLVYVAGNVPFNTWLVKSYMDNIPRSLDEAARIDGASSFRIFRSIIFPQARPIVTFLAIVSFTAPWMDFIIPTLVLRSAERITLPLGLLRFVAERTAQDFTRFAAGSLLVAVPFIIYFILMQKSIVTSLGGAGVKE
jgi:arabinogalactan oligomer/maltooligosaccharide transport system permease protein